MVRHPEHLQQMETNNIDEIERMLQRIGEGEPQEGESGGNGGKSALVTSSVGENGAMKKLGVSSSN